MSTVTHVIFSVLSVCVLGIHGYSSGAPTSACQTVEPGSPHRSSGRLAVIAQTGTDIFEIVSNKATFKPNEAVQLTIQGKSSESFKGFLIRAYDQAGDSLGEFTAGTNAQTVNCDTGIPNAATHDSATTKTTAMVSWKAPANSMATHVDFKLAVVETKYVWWTNINKRVSAGAGKHEVTALGLTMAAFVMAVNNYF